MDEGEIGLLNLLEYLEHSAARVPEQLSFCGEDRCFTFSQSLAGMCARSGVFMYKYIIPSSSKTVAYLAFARGQNLRVQRPATLNFLQKLQLWTSLL